jgi:hypothetical protein
MKHNKKLLHFLQTNGILENGSDEEIAKAKSEFWKEENKERLKKFRTQHHRHEISLSQDDFNLLSLASKKYGVQLGTFIRIAAIAYVRSEYLLPSDSRIQELEVAIRRIGNNINQLTRHVHQSGFTQGDLESLQNKLNELEDKIAHTIRQPLPLNEFLKLLLKRNPEYAPMIEQVLKEFRNDH